MAATHVRTKDPGEGDYIRYVPAETSVRRKVLAWMRTNCLLMLTIAGVFCGFLAGFLCRVLEPSQGTIELVSFPGELLMRMLKMLILPLIISSLITGMAQLDAKSSGRMGSRALVYYMVTTLLAAVVGIIMVVSIHPGDSSTKQGVENKEAETPVSTKDALLDIAR